MHTLNKEYLMDYNKEAVASADFRVTANQVASRSKSEENAYSVGNAIKLDIRRKHLYHKNGMTMEKGVAKLFAEAARKSNNSATLAHNVTAFTDKDKNLGHHAHHIVAQRAKSAADSRAIIFGVGIGINDYRNGVFLPPEKHKGLHTLKYYVQVNFLLELSRADGQVGVGETLVEIGKSIYDETFI